MNLIIMCLSYLFINFAYLQVSYARKHLFRPSKPQCDNGLGSCIPPQHIDRDESLVNSLIKKEHSKEIENIGGLEKFQLSFPTFKKFKNKKPEEVKEKKQKKRRRKKWRRRMKSRERNQLHKLRHSRNKQKEKSEWNIYHPSNVSFDTKINDGVSEQIIVDIPGNDLGNEIEELPIGSSPLTTLEFGKKKTRKGPNKGSFGRRRHFNPSRGAKKVVVRTHNILRGRVWPPAQNMLAMSWNTEAAESAQVWADECHLDSDADHPSVRWTQSFGTCGQNIHVTFKKKRWGRVIRQWWGERRYFFYGHPNNNVTKVGRYTQMAWYNSHQVGCGFAQCKPLSGKPFYRYVCNYCPSGNDPERISHPYNKGTQCGDCSSSCISLCPRDGCKLCTNSCPFADLWSNCENLVDKWKQWVCNTKTRDGVVRFKNCRATCQCSDKIT